MIHLLFVSGLLKSGSIVDTILDFLRGIYCVLFHVSHSQNKNLFSIIKNMYRLLSSFLP